MLILNELFQARYFATRGPVLWPPRSPHMGFHFWYFLKVEVYKNCYTNIEELLLAISIDGRTVLKAT